MRSLEKKESRNMGNDISGRKVRCPKCLFIMKYNKLDNHNIRKKCPNCGWLHIIEKKWDRNL